MTINLSFAPGAPSQVQPQGGAAPFQGAQYGAQAQDPQSVYLAHALASMGQHPQGNTMGLASNLLADALDQYALQQRRQQLLGGQPPGQQNLSAPTATPDGSLDGAWPGLQPPPAPYTGGLVSPLGS